MQIKCREKVNVIIPSYNHGKYIKECILSVYYQDYVNFDITVIDDGSTDDTKDILGELAKQIRFKYICRENRGLTATLNELLASTEGDYVVPFASDDIMMQGRLKDQVILFNQLKDADAVSGYSAYIDESGEVIKMPSVLKNKKHSVSFLPMLFKNSVSAPTAMIRRSAIEEVGGYSEEYKIEDIHMWLTLLSRGKKIYVCDRVWAKYRIINSLTKSKIYKYHKELIRIYKGFSSHSKVVYIAIAFEKFKYLIRLTRYKFKI